ncbi:hypothetical protein A3K73_03210 [Candidatus Pacearchaeota archaeon RBG_13_36_9]|nr:MAG: hypothetical protein A3K73_03210 [Candidatus Pacearchaeota archaeon RBG_13_36_9]HJX50889.1 HAD-IA family hydrolase [Candidatus Nanoarchaeia archaeon]
MRSKKIYFDLDDTLVNTRETILKRIALLLGRYPLDVDSSFVYNLLGNPEREQLLSKNKLLSQSFWSAYERLRKDITPDSFPRAKEILEGLVSEGKTIGIITNNTCLKTLEKLRAARISPSLFRGNIYSCSENGRLKPSPDITIHCGLGSGDFVYVGDDIIDYEFARNSGADFYGVCTRECKEGEFIKAGLSKARIFPSVREVFQR